MNIHDWVGDYALHTLTEAETAEFEAHLAECEPCREELASFDVVLEALAEDGADGPVEVPAGFAERLAAELAVTEQDAVVVGPVVDAEPIATVTPIRSRFVPRLLVAAAAVFAAAFIGVAGLIIAQPSDAERIIAASDVQEFELALGETVVFASASEGGVVVQGDAPELAADQTYQLWVVPADGSAPIPGPTVGGGDVDETWMTDLDDAAAIAVSLEPEGGSETPTEVLAAVEL